MSGLLSCGASYISEIELNGVTVTADRILGKEGTGFTCIVNTSLDNGRYCVAWMGIALAQEALEVMVTYSRKRSQSGEKLYQFQLIKGTRGCCADANR